MFNTVFLITYTITCRLIIYIPQCNAVVSPLDPKCQDPLGLENKNIGDSNIKTLTGIFSAEEEGKYARLNNKLAWCSPSSRFSDASFTSNIYIEISLLAESQITALALQGWNQYGYGDFIRIRYEFVGNLVYYKNKDGVKDISVKNLKYDAYEYVVLEPPLTTNRLRIYLQQGHKKRCLRAELYGCEYFGGGELEYEECPTTDQTLLTERLLSENNVKYITESAKVRTHDFDGEKILFSQPLAWCVKKGNIPTDFYEEWVQINMRNEYLLYGLKVNGYDGAQYITEGIKLYYSLDSSKWAAYEGGRVISTADYRNTVLKFKPPLVAKFVKAFIRLNSTENTCLKMQLYGCQALTYEEIVATTPAGNKNTSVIPTPAVKANVVQYKMYQGNAYSNTISWKDTKYKGKMNHKGELSGDKGCLIDRQYVSDSNPIKDPTCWIGWKKTNVSEPFIEVETSQVASFTSMYIRTYINEDIGASTIKRFIIEYSESIGVEKLLGYICAPKESYHISPQIKDFYINLDNIKAQYVKVKFEYSGQWILVRQIMVKQEPVTGDHYMKLSVAPLTCEIPSRTASGKEESDSTKIVIIVCAVLGLCLFLLLGFLLYHYRTSIHHVFKARTGEPIILRTSYEKKMDRSTVHMMGENNGYDRMTRQGSQPSFMNRYNSDRSNDDIYAAPDVCSINSDKSLLLSDSSQYPQYPQYPVYDDVSDGRPPNYGKPNGALQYSTPNHPVNPNPTYHGSAIYAKSFKSPYQAVVASSIYSDPRKVINTTTLTQFPREQLSFKEKIGVGQFGEVHIAEATGLDEIYGNIGHYNSWGCTDTALVAIKVLKSEDDMVAEEFLKEVEVMAQLKHENVVRLLGVCKDKPMIMVCEYMENGDLNQFLQKRNPCDEQNVRASMIPPDVLLSDSLLHMAQQIAAGMKYLHAEGFIHRDLATRNCLVGPAYQVKVADFGMSRCLYSKQYYRVEGKAILPIRWMAPECMFYGKFTNCTDVWSFGVTLWEIFGFARQPPYGELSDPEIIELSCEAIQHPEGGFSYLPQPVHCPPEIYELMRKCWEMEPENRPSFAYMNRFFIDLCHSSEGLI